MERLQYGYTGTFLDINLTTMQVARPATDADLARRFLGGMGYAAKILFDEVGPGIEPFSPDNIVIFAAGPLTATRSPASGRMEVTTKSPLNNLIGTGNGGGRWGAFLKRAGYDMIVVRGCADRPVYLWIDDERVELRDASHLWGKDAWETSDQIRSELGEAGPLSKSAPRISVTAIGPAGENLIRYACPITDYYHAAARAGAGGVLGSKKLKAIAVRGSKPVKLANPAEFARAADDARHAITSNPRSKTHGAVGSFAAAKIYEEKGFLPGKNFQTGVIPSFNATRGKEAAIRYVTKKEGSCYGCPMPCFNLAEINDGPHAGLKVSNATFFSVVIEFGAKCCLADLPAIWKCKEICHRLGMDYGSASGSISFAMELYQRGIITRDEADGLDLTWGNENSILTLLERIARREGLGDLLAEGSLKAAHRIGKGAEEYAMVIKGMEMMWSDPRSGTRGWMSGYLTNPRGGDNIKGTHTRAADYANPDWPPEKFDMFDDVRERIYGSPSQVEPYNWKGKADFCKWMEDLCSVLNSVGICFFPVTNILAIGPTQIARMLTACTGWSLTPQELMQAGERVFNLLKAYNLREGMTRKDDDWPERFYREPLPDGPSRGTVLTREEINGFLDDYYMARGWDIRSGLPTQQTFSRLALEDVADGLRGKVETPST